MVFRVSPNNFPVKGRVFLPILIYELCLRLLIFWGIFSFFCSFIWRKPIKNHFRLYFICHETPAPSSVQRKGEGCGMFSLVNCTFNLTNIFLFVRYASVIERNREKKKLISCYYIRCHETPQYTGMLYDMTYNYKLSFMNYASKYSIFYVLFIHICSRIWMIVMNEVCPLFLSSELFLKIFKILVYLSTFASVWTKWINKYWSFMSRNTVMYAGRWGHIMWYLIRSCFFWDVVD